MAEIVSAQITGGRSFVGVTVKSSPLAGVKKALKELKTQGIKELMRQLGEFWRSDILPRHFIASNRTDYNIAPRTVSYWIGRPRADGGFGIGAKRRYGIGKGTSVANVFSGRTERMARYASDTITSTSKRVTIPVNVPSYFSKPDDPFGNQPDKVGETLQVNQRDISLMNNFVIQRLIGIENDFLSRAA